MSVIVTGAAGVLGRAVCTYLTAQGTKVIGVDLIQPSTKLPDIERFISGVDLTDALQVQSCFSELFSDGIELDGLVNVAGGFVWVPTHEAEPAVWAKMHAINFITALNMSRAALPKLKVRGGAIVNIGAAAAVRAGAGMGPYTASKAAVAKLTESMAEEYKSDGPRVNAILPSIIDTPTNRQDMPDADFSTWVTAQEIAATVAFLLSPQASGITGALIPVTGRV